MATETLRPNAAGTYEEVAGSTSGAGNHWQDVDEAVADDGTTYNGVETADPHLVFQHDTYNIPNSGVGAGTINHVTLHFRARCNAGGSRDERYKATIYTHSNLYHGNEETPDGLTWTDYSKQWTTNPNTGSAWTWDEINALEIGWSGTRDFGRWVQCTQIYVVVDYTAVTPKTSSDAGSGVDAYVSLEQGVAKSSSDAGSGVEGIPTQATAVADSELGGGSDSLQVKTEIPNKGGGTKLWT